MLQFNHLSLRRGHRLLFEDAAFQVYPGQKVGITGANGSGKSSLFALILDQLHADVGDLRCPKDWVIAHVAQEMPADKRAAIEYVLDGDRQLREIEDALAQAERDGDGERLALQHGRFEAADGYTARSRAGQLLHGLGFKPGEEARPVAPPPREVSPRLDEDLRTVVDRMLKDDVVSMTELSLMVRDVERLCGLAKDLPPPSRGDWIRKR